MELLRLESQRAAIYDLIAKTPHKTHEITGFGAHSKVLRLLHDLEHDGLIKSVSEGKSHEMRWCVV